MNGTDTVLTDAGKGAAEAMCQLLIITYKAGVAKEKADGLICHYFEEYFRPEKSTIGDRAFIFQPTARKVAYNFGDHYEMDKKKVILKYDRFLYYSVMLSVQSDYSKRQLVNAFGIEFERYISPKAADKSYNSITRMPIGYGFAMSSYNNQAMGSTFASRFRVKGFMSCSIMLPLINASFDPHVGIGVFPAATATRFSALGGADLVWNLGDDFFIINSHPRTLRLTLGYEYDPWNTFLKNSFKLKVGYNTWRGKVVIPRKKRAVTTS
jgi:hypothetical protein